MDQKPLKDVRVLDFTRFFAGPFCTMLLGDLGADVVKVEPPAGDPIRRQGPPFYQDLSMGFLAVNRNKRSIVLDIGTTSGKDIARRLALKADVIVENFRPGVMERLGLGYAGLAAEHPRLVYAAISGMGADGPDRDVGAFDLTVQAEGGYMSITGARGAEPVKLGTSAFDLVCGQYAMGAIVTALLWRERSGQGQRIDTSLFESEITFLVDAAMEYFVTGHSRERWGSEHASVVPYKAFKTADGWAVVGAGVQNLFEAFVKVLGRDDLKTDPRFATLPQRVTNRAALYAILDREVERHSTAALIAELRKRDIPCAPVNRVEDVFRHPQALHRGMMQRVEHPRYGGLPVVGSAVKYSVFDVVSGWQSPPLLGEHTDAVLREWLGLTAPPAAAGG